MTTVLVLRLLRFVVLTHVEGSPVVPTKSYFYGIQTCIGKELLYKDIIKLYV